MSTPTEELGEKIIPVLRRHGVVHAAIFGSFARRIAGKESDLDVLVEFEDDRSLLDLVSLRLDLSETLGRHVDALTYRSLHPRIRERVLQERVAIL
jgi:predicted nucleotidyltransferase